MDSQFAALSLDKETASVSSPAIYEADGLQHPCHPAAKVGPGCQTRMGLTLTTAGRDRLETAAEGEPLRTLVRTFNNVASSMGGLRPGPHIPTWHVMACVAPELLTLLIAERLALERLKRLRGYPDKSVIDAAEKLWREAAEAVRNYRTKNA
jgi:hypothetical protein